MQPLTYPRHPNAMPYHSNGVLPASSTPPFFYPSNQPVGAEYTANARQAYIRSSTQMPPATNVPSTQYHIAPSGWRTLISSQVNYKAPTDSSMRTHALRAHAIGATTNHPLISTKSVDKNESNRAMRRCRSGGYMVPKKAQMKRAVYIPPPQDDDIIDTTGPAISNPYYP